MINIKTFNRTVSLEFYLMLNHKQQGTHSLDRHKIKPPQADSSLLLFCYYINKNVKIYINVV